MDMRRLTPQEEQFYNGVDAIVKSDEKRFNDIQNQNVEKFPEIFGPLSHFRYEYITHKKALSDQYPDSKSEDAKAAFQQLDINAKKFADDMMNAIKDGSVDSYQFKWHEEQAPDGTLELPNDYQIPNYRRGSEKPIFEAVNKHIENAVALDLAILNPAKAPQILTDRPDIRGPYALYQTEVAGATTPSEVSALQPLRANLVQMTLSRNDNDKQAVANLNEQFDRTLSKEQGSELT